MWRPLLINSRSWQVGIRYPTAAVFLLPPLALTCYGIWFRYLGYRKLYVRWENKQERLFFFQVIFKKTSLIMILSINTSSSSHPPLRLSRGFSFRKILLFWVKLNYFMYHKFLWNTYLALRSTGINILMGLSKRLIWCWTGECYSTIDGRWIRWPLGSWDFLAGEGWKWHHCY